MNYISTRGQVSPIGFQDAVLMGLADDGGLIIPESIPDVSAKLAAWRELSYPQLAYEIISLFATDIPKDDLREIIEKTYSHAFEGGVAPVVPVGDLFIQELWHGPTLAFKDVALQLLGNLFEYILGLRGGRLNILGATSGDTGSAAIYGCRGRSGLDIFVMHPDGRVSPIQERQMTTVLDDNVHNMAIKGSFDDCQNIMKTLAADLEFKRQYSLGAVNSVNWARVLAQVVYYFSGAFDVCKLTGAEKIRVSVPTGNFGDVLAGWFAMKMGAPIDQLILATNENDILCRFFNTGEYSLGKVFYTLSPSMDIQVASNFERYLYYKLGSNPVKLREKMAGFAKTGSLRVELDDDGPVDADFVSAKADRQQVINTISRYYQEYNYVLDPHTAVGVFAAEQAGPKKAGPAGAGKEGVKKTPVLCLATAHPAKFPAAIEEAAGNKNLAHHPKIDALMEMETRCEKLPNDKEAVREFMKKTLD